MKREDRPLYAPLRDDPPVTPSQAMSWPYVTVLTLILCVFLGAFAAFVIENWPQIAAAFSL